MTLDDADRAVIAKVIAVLVLIVLVAATLGIAIRAFLWASGLGA